MPKLEWDELWAAMKAKPAEWIETTEEMYWHMLEVVPPRCQTRSAFLVGEADHHNEQGHAVYAAFKQQGDSYSACYMTVAEFEAMSGRFYVRPSKSL